MDLIDEIIERARISTWRPLSAEANNTLSGCVSTHPWCAGKTDLERAYTARLALAGYGCGLASHQLEVIEQRERRVLLVLAMASILCALTNSKKRRLNALAIGNAGVITQITRRRRGFHIGHPLKPCL